MKGSGKQILMSVLKELSTRRVPDTELDKATSRIRAALLWHGSSSEDNFRRARVLRWANSPGNGVVERQGLATQSGRLLLSDFLETMFEMPGMQRYMLESFEGLSEEDYEAAKWALWCLVSAPQMFSELLEVEAANDDELQVEKWIEDMREKYDFFTGND